jgi:SAM-dependent methyltransferase
MLLYVTTIGYTGKMNNELEAKTIQTYDTTALHWAKNHTVVNDWEETAAQFKELLPAGKIIEIGCGGGRDAAELIRLGYDYFGTDASAGMIDVAHTVVPHGRFQQYNVYDIAKLGKQFDGFWACSVLLHIPKERINEALGAINASLRTGAIGMVSIKDGSKEEFEVRDKDGAREERLFVYWSKEEFAAVLKRNGFEVIEYSYRPVNERTSWHIFFVSKI